MARLALGPVDLESGPALELLSLCQTVTEDGSITDQEVDALRAWLETNRSAALPAIGVLGGLVEAILADGRITAVERAELHRTIERVLPPDLRAIATSRRRLATAAAREQARATKAAERERKKQEALRDRPIDGANFMVAGARYEGRDKVIARYARAGDTVYLVRDPANRYSRNAIEVRLANGLQIGFVPEEFAVELAPLLDGGALHVAVITKILDRGKTPIPVVDVDLYNRDAQVTGLVGPGRELPAAAMPRARTGGGSLARLIGWCIAIPLAILVVRGLAGH